MSDRQPEDDIASPWRREASEELVEPDDRDAGATGDPVEGWRHGVGGGRQAAKGYPSAGPQDLAEAARRSQP